MAKTKAGLGICPICNEGVVWKIADGGSLSFTCQHCDFRGYAPAHSDANKIIGAKVAGVVPAPAPAPDPKPAALKVQPKTAKPADPVPVPAPAPKAKPAGIWDHLVKGAAA